MSDCFRRSIVSLALSLLVAGCAASPERQAQLDNDRCTTADRQPGSKAHDDCVSRVVAQRDTRLQARHRELVEQRAPTPYNRY
jgi:uncharacterized protein YecT (DUF1311 family)